MRFVALILLALLCPPVFCADDSATIQRIIEITNKERRLAGMSDLKPNSILETAARTHAANMALQENLSHTLNGKGVAERAEEAGYRYMAVGENIAWNHDSAAAVMKGWMESQGHKENILSRDYTEIGVAIANDKKGQPYYVQVFGTALPAARAAASAPAGTSIYVITNRSGATLTVTLPSGKSSQLETDTRCTYTITSSAAQPISVKGDAKAPVFELRSSGSYIVKSGDKGIELLPEKN